MSAYLDLQFAPALLGLLFLSNLRQNLCPGTASSREKAKHIRDAAVTQDIPQKNCPTKVRTMISFAQTTGNEVMKMIGENPNHSFIASTFVEA